ncbi:MAG: NAD(P)H-quinone oxidoreductase subunit 3 [Deltaproteobacteria bacterium]|nr:NAD(P)H-quinone oxidoreductase subunit 3 [Deltaproteobacteria bacterium]
MLSYEAILLLIVLGIAISVVFVLISKFLGPKNPNARKKSVYECGAEPQGSARKRFPVKFYMIALLFLLFDIEAVFLYPWAKLFRELGFLGFVEMGIFMLVLIVGLIYAWRKGALEWE